ncbi:hypothetical protein JTE90_018517 [Oedothorax gibbosus]|uniref:Endonuclease/exonuclease/phosphatase domain-containing protein n=1 Tax=Oedothorax gibbosus TaxID=931172 RepID=A0AAV6UMG5_9ARAC|nr:hypothetical protein JTE90_018517 [Oedothorax gibbosus]
MSDSDTLEAFEIRVWKQNMGHRITFVYNPPRNKPDLDCLIQDWNKRSIILGDFNAHSTRWGYRQSCVIGKLMEDFIDSSEIDCIENDGGQPTFLSFGGASSHPDLLLTHPNLSPHINHSLLAPPDDNNDKALDQIVFGIKECALACISRGHVKNAKLFWNDNLQLLKEDRDRARLAAEISGQLQDCVTLRQKNAALRKAILQAKRTSYQTFLEDLDYRKNGQKAFKFVSALNGKRIQASKQPIEISGKL